MHVAHILQGTVNDIRICVLVEEREVHAYAMPCVNFYGAIISYCFSFHINVILPYTLTSIQGTDVRGFHCKDRFKNEGQIQK